MSQALNHSLHALRPHVGSPFTSVVDSEVVDIAGRVNSNLNDASDDSIFADDWQSLQISQNLIRITETRAISGALIADVQPRSLIALCPKTQRKRVRNRSLTVVESVGLGITRLNVNESSLRKLNLSFRPRGPSCMLLSK